MAEARGWRYVPPAQEAQPLLNEQAEKPIKTLEPDAAVGGEAKRVRNSTRTSRRPPVCICCSEPSGRHVVRAGAASEAASERSQAASAAADEDQEEEEEEQQEQEQEQEEPPSRTLTVLEPWLHPSSPWWLDPDHRWQSQPEVC
jgi:hypothetical protein